MKLTQIQTKRNTNQHKYLCSFVFIAVLIWVFLPKAAGAAEAALFFIPGTGEYQVGSTFLVKLRIDSDGAPINAAQAKILFPQEILEVESVSKTDSIFRLWPEEPIFSNSKGEISFQGGVPAPGFTGLGTILNIDFKAKKVGQAKISLSGAAVLAADGRGTNILEEARGATFSIIEGVPEIFSPTHPKENLWYQNPNPEFQWEIGPDIIGVRYKLDQNPSSVPKTLAEKAVDSKRFEQVKDGIWYFHLEVQNKTGWSKTSHYKVQIDTTPPHPFEVIIDNQGDPTNPQPFLYFKTKDDLSGISHYEIRIGKGDIFSPVIAETNPIHLPHQAPGSHEILVKAIDQAGNSEESSALLNVESIPIPEISVYPETYNAGEEIFYIEGTAEPDLTAILFLKKNGKTLRTWETTSDNNGNWSFSTSELFKSSNYLISARSRDKKGAISDLSPEYQIKVVLAGISIGPLIITHRILLPVLIILIALILTIVIRRILSKKKKLRKETREAADSLKNAFDEMKKKITKKIEYLDSKPGLSPEEKKLRDEIFNILKTSEEAVSKEIEDIEKEL